MFEMASVCLRLFPREEKSPNRLAVADRAAHSALPTPCAFPRCSADSLCTVCGVAQVVELLIAALELRAHVPDPSALRRLLFPPHVDPKNPGVKHGPPPAPLLLQV